MGRDAGAVEAMSRRFVFLIVLLLAPFLRAADRPPVVLVSMDGFRWDYCDLHPDETPHLRELRRDGFSARSLVPVFPSNTFPNHYSIVTGLYPAHHGIVNNDFFEPASGRFFHYNQPIFQRDPHWWGGEPIWVTAIKQGQRAAASFWVGSEAAIDGVRPTFWKPYDYTIPFETRLAEVVRWLTMPPDQRVSFVAIYLEETNSVGHEFGPDSPQLAATLKLLDGRIGAMQAAFRTAGLDPNLVIVSDHGMTPLASEHVLIIDDYIDLTSAQVDAEGPVAGFRPHDGDVGALVQRLEKVPHTKTFRAEDLPERFHMRDNPRIPPVLVLADEGWHFVTRAVHERNRKKFAAAGYLRAEHGYDPALRDMHGILIAHGPSFRQGVVGPEVENVHVYNLLCALLGLKPAPNDGDGRLVDAALKN
jgi:predicted AlkP superfamily pyrophosphatase or phosphodiesterase